MLQEHSARFDLHSKSLNVCRNFVTSLPELKEEIRRETVYAYDHIVEEKKLDSDASQFACSAVRACRAEMERLVDHS